MTTITIPLAMLVEAAAALKTIYLGNGCEPIGSAAWEACVDAHCHFGIRVQKLIALHAPIEVTTREFEIAAIEAIQTIAFADGFKQAIKQGEAVAS